MQSRLERDNAQNATLLWHRLRHILRKTNGSFGLSSFLPMRASSCWSSSVFPFPWWSRGRQKTSWWRAMKTMPCSWVKTWIIRYSRISYFLSPVSSERSGSGKNFSQSYRRRTLWDWCLWFLSSIFDTYFTSSWTTRYGAEQPWLWCSWYWLSDVLWRECLAFLESIQLIS